jgi:hypothetical protein
MYNVKNEICQETIMTTTMLKRQPKVRSESGYSVVNYMEELVNDTLRGLIADLPKTQRPSSRREADIKALALNRLWPMYMTTNRGKRFIQKDVVTDRIDRDVARELRAAIDLVTRRPNS